MVTPAPIIIIGMHRSGTSMITQMLEKLGLFMGWRKDENDEALFFRDLNDWILRSTGGAWDHPEPVQSLLECNDARHLTVDYLQHMMRTPRFASFLGIPRYLRTIFSQSPFPHHWGWKDPRNSFTLPIWLDIFPEAKVIHIARHGVDVAKSLQARELKHLPDAMHRHRTRRRLGFYAIKPKQGGFLSSPRSSTLDGGFSLWESYMRACEIQLNTLGQRGLSIKYEDFLTAPAMHLQAIANFCGICTSDDTVRELTRGLRPDRAFAFQSDPALRHFCDRVSARLEVFGYDTCADESRDFLRQSSNIDLASKGISLN